MLTAIGAVTLATAVLTITVTVVLPKSERATRTGRQIKVPDADNRVSWNPYRERYRSSPVLGQRCSVSPAR
jgi:hypothetical protein